MTGGVNWYQAIVLKHTTKAARKNQRKKRTK
jgi:hypothetical protein